MDCCAAQEPSLFAVAKLLETGLVNMDRIQILWRPLTGHLLEVCLEVICSDDHLLVAPMLFTSGIKIYFLCVVKSQSDNVKTLRKCTCNTFRMGNNSV